MAVLPDAATTASLLSHRGSPRRKPPRSRQHLELVLNWSLKGSPMSKVKDLEQQVKALSPEELAQFREWFLEFDWVLWDRQLERDVRAGRLDAMAEKALRDHAAGKTKPL